MVRSQVLIVEDEQDIADLIKHALERDGQTSATIVGTGEEALVAVNARLPDVMLLDLNLPVLGGREVCRILRGRADSKDLPIIMLTARTSEADRVDGLERGADDYVTKPFSLRELTARIQALLRRRRSAPEEPPRQTYTGEHLTADFDGAAVAVDGQPVRLTRRELDLLHYLVQNKSRPVSRDRLLERVWCRDRSIEARSVDVHIGRLRTKLGAAGYHIETLIGLGYRFVD